MTANYVLNPYCGEVNPCTADGLKLYNKALEAPNLKIKMELVYSQNLGEHPLYTVRTNKNLMQTNFFLRTTLIPL